MENRGTKTWKIMVEAVRKLKGDIEYRTHYSIFVFNNQSSQVRIYSDKGGEVQQRIGIEFQT